MKLTGLTKMQESSGDTAMTPQEAAEHFSKIKNNRQECFSVLTLNAKNKLINSHLISIGLVNSTCVHARETFYPAILDGAVSIIIGHNHPSGDPSPSTQDVRLTRMLIDSGGILGIPIRDHIIVSSSGFVSMREGGCIQFS